mmetsp:Transcript_6392/g.11387  ORF Transcript_6392/g.11387 Transcript_6392/m.11387 type:complete len:153 (-) Transcript_6392:1319-1777(-)
MQLGDKSLTICDTPAYKVRDSDFQYGQYNAHVATADTASVLPTDVDSIHIPLPSPRDSPRRGPVDSTQPHGGAHTDSLFSDGPKRLPPKVLPTVWTPGTSSNSVPGAILPLLGTWYTPQHPQRMHASLFPKYLECPHGLGQAAGPTASPALP